MKTTVRIPPGNVLPSVAEMVTKVGERFVMKTLAGSRWILVHGLKLTGAFVTIDGWQYMEIDYEDLGEAPSSLRNGERMLGYEAPKHKAVRR